MNEVVEILVLTTVVAGAAAVGYLAIQFIKAKIEGKKKPETEVERKARLYDERNLKK